VPWCGGPIKRCALVWWAHQALCRGCMLGEDHALGAAAPSSAAPWCDNSIGRCAAIASSVKIMPGVPMSACRCHQRPPSVLDAFKRLNAHMRSCSWHQQLRGSAWSPVHAPWFEPRQYLEHQAYLQGRVWPWPFARAVPNRTHQSSICMTLRAAGRTGWKCPGLSLRVRTPQ